MKLLGEFFVKWDKPQWNDYEWYEMGILTWGPTWAVPIVHNIVIDAFPYPSTPNVSWVFNSVS
jgi:hypothetical protein